MSITYETFFSHIYFTFFICSFIWAVNRHFEDSCIVPYKIEVADDCLEEYNQFGKEIMEKRSEMKAQILSEKQANIENNFFIINIPKMRFYKKNAELRVQTDIELYSKNTNEILLSQSHIGIPESGLTDYPMCMENGLDCTIVILFIQI